MRLIHSCFVRNEEHCIASMLESVMPYVDDSYIIIDDRTTDRTEEIANDFGCHTKRIKFENFGKLNNTLMWWINDKADWSFGLAPDELITQELGNILRQLIN